MFDHCHAGFDHHLVKPIDTRQLIELLAEFARHDPRRRPVTRWPLKANRDNFVNFSVRKFGILVGSKPLRCKGFPFRTRQPLLHHTALTGRPVQRTARRSNRRG